MRLPVGTKVRVREMVSRGMERVEIEHAGVVVEDPRSHVTGRGDGLVAVQVDLNAVDPVPPGHFDRGIRFYRVDQLASMEIEGRATREDMGLYLEAVAACNAKGDALRDLLALFDEMAGVLDAVEAHANDPRVIAARSLASSGTVHGGAE